MAVDIRCALPQELVGGGRGQPCSRKRVLTKQDLLPEIYGAKPPPPQPLTSDARNAEQTAFSGTQNLPVGLARARSLGALQRGSAVDKALAARHQSDLEILIEVLMQAARADKPRNIRYFRQPYNPHRDAFVKSREYSQDQLRSKVLHTLMKYPLADVYDLIQCDEQHWSSISRELGGISHGVATKAALEHVSKTMVASDRAAFWASVGNRIRTIDHGKVFSIPGSSRALTGENAEPGLRVTHPQKGNGLLMGWTHKDHVYGHFHEGRASAAELMGAQTAFDHMAEQSGMSMSGTRRGQTFSGMSGTHGIFPNGVARIKFDNGDPYGTDVDMSVVKLKE